MIGVIRSIYNLKIKKFEIKKLLKERFSNSDIQVRNDAKCAGIAEHKYGSLKNIDDCVFLTIGTGIGRSYIFRWKFN